MKTGKLVALILAVVLLVAGLAFVLVGMFVMDFSLPSLSPTSPNFSTHIIDQPVTQIVIEDTDTDIQILPSEHGNFRLQFREAEKVPHQFSVENGILVIRQQDNRQWYDHIGIFWEETEVLLYLPQETYTSLQVSTNTGDVHVSSACAFGSAQISTSTGDVEFYAGVSQSLDVRTSTGDIQLGGVHCQSITLQNNTGDMELANLATDQQLQIETSTGDVELTGITAQAMTIQSSTGDVECSGCDAQTVNIQTSTGDIEGSFRSEMQFSVTSNTGHVSVPMSVGDGICKVTSDTGDIHIRIQP